MDLTFPQSRQSLAQLLPTATEALLRHSLLAHSQSIQNIQRVKESLQRYSPSNRSLQYESWLRTDAFRVIADDLGPYDLWQSFDSSDPDFPHRLAPQSAV